MRRRDCDKIDGNAPVTMALILDGQIGDLFTMDAETQGRTVYYIGYVIGFVILFVGWIVAFTAPGSPVRGSKE